MVIFATPDTIIADTRARSTIVAASTDAYGNPLGAGRQVSFTSDYGSIISPATTDSNGIATTEYSGSEDIVSVRIEANLDLANAWTYIEQIETTATFITVSASPNRVVANGTDSCMVVARVLDASAMPVSDGIVVNFRSRDASDTTSVGDLSLFATTIGGNATVWWRSPTYSTSAIVYGNVFGLEDSALVDLDRKSVV